MARIAQDDLFDPVRRICAHARDARRRRVSPAEIERELIELGTELLSHALLASLARQLSRGPLPWGAGT